MQEFGRALRVDAHIAADLVHRLPNAYGCSKVIDNIYATQDLTHAIRVANVSDDELYIRREVVRRTILVNLRGEIVYDADLVTGAKKAISEMGADEACTTSDQNLFSGLRHNATTSSTTVCVFSEDGARGGA